MQRISRDETRELLEQRGDLVVIETLDEPSYQEGHLPGAYHVPVDEHFREVIVQLAPDKTAPVLVHCSDADCGSALEAAAQLEELGYIEVYEYEAGKVDWTQAGLPIEQSDE